MVLFSKPWKCRWVESCWWVFCLRLWIESFSAETTVNGHSWSTYAVRPASCWRMQDPLFPHRKPLQLLVRSILKAKGFRSCSTSTYLAPFFPLFLPFLPIPRHIYTIHLCDCWAVLEFHSCQVSSVSGAAHLMVNLIGAQVRGLLTAGILTRRLVQPCMTAHYPRATCWKIELTF